MGKRNSYTIQKKRDCLLKYDQTKRYPDGVKRTTFRGWIKNRESIFTYPKTRFMRNRNNPIKGMFDPLEQILIKQITDRRAHGQNVDRPLTQKMGRTIRDQLIKNYEKPGLTLSPRQIKDKERLERFSASLGWVRNFMIRFSLSLRKVTKHTYHTPPNAEELRLGFINEIQALMKKHHITDMDDIINMDEISVVTTPEVGKQIEKIGAKQVLTNGEQRTRECMSVAITVRASGSFMFSTFIFKRLKKVPKAIEQIKDDNLYLVSLKGWMTSYFFNQWYTKLHDQLFSGPPKGLFPQFYARHVIVVVDHCGSHTIDKLPSLTYSKQIHFVLVPKLMTPYCQPLDVGINVQIKRIYKYGIAQFQEHQYKNQLNLIPKRQDIVKYLSEAIKQVNKETIVKSFTHCGVVKDLVSAIPSTIPVIQHQEWQDEVIEVQEPQNEEGDEEVEEEEFEEFEECEEHEEFDEFE